MPGVRKSAHNRYGRVGRRRQRDWQRERFQHLVHCLSEIVTYPSRDREGADRFRRRMTAPLRSRLGSNASHFLRDTTLAHDTSLAPLWRGACAAARRRACGRAVFPGGRDRFATPPSRAERPAHLISSQAGRSLRLSPIYGLVGLAGSAGFVG
jgi:hypothetical protein